MCYFQISNVWIWAKYCTIMVLNWIRNMSVVVCNIKTVHTSQKNTFFSQKTDYEVHVFVYLSFIKVYLIFQDFIQVVFSVVFTSFRWSLMKGIKWTVLLPCRSSSENVMFRESKNSILKTSKSVRIFYYELVVEI